MKRRLLSLSLVSVLTVTGLDVANAQALRPAMGAVTAQAARPGISVAPGQTGRPGLSAVPAQTARPVPRGTRPLKQRQVRVTPIPAALAWRAVRTGPHTIYGIITALQGNVVVVRTRNGRLAPVNATAAIAHGDYSAPLFIGKIVAVDGSVYNGTFIAAHLFRLENLNALPNDH